MIRSRRLGTKSRLTAGLAFHYSPLTSGSSYKPCEAAYLAVKKDDAQESHTRVPVIVLASPTNFENLKQAYAHISGVTVKKFLLKSHQLPSSAVLTLMGVNTNRNFPAWYIQQLTSILRKMVRFDYQKFKMEVAKLRSDLDVMQMKYIKQRVAKLNDFLDLSGNTSDEVSDFEDGTLTILDMSSPLDDKETALQMFTIALGMFFESGSPGRVAALDEAHKVEIYP